MIGAALAFKAAPYAIAAALAGGGLLYVTSLRADNENKSLAISALQKRAVELHGAWEAERSARATADASNARLSRSLLAQRERSAKRDVELRELARSDPKVRQWRSGGLARSLDERLRSAYHGATGPRRAGAAARDTDKTVPGAP